MNGNKKIREYYAEERRILKHAMQKKKLVVFVGAGVSLDAGVPGWHEAITMIAKRLNRPDEEIDYLKIPQFYYNARGKKEYVETIKKIFKCDANLDVQEIHRNIVKLDVNTIITTNYDCLLEKAFEENCELIQIISQDKDLPYKTAGKELLKIHGDFAHDNFVLKEDDYLHYSKNFKLIEAYIKSLIATNVILFVGYSFRDPDIKQIFSWVKDILENDFQRAYMLEVSKEYDYYEDIYYKNLGINIIYAAKMYDNFDKNNASVYANDFIKYILEEDQNIAEIDRLYKKCKLYSDLNYISNKYINSIFQEFEIYVDQKLVLSGSSVNNKTKDLLTFLTNEENNIEKEKRDLIISVIDKSAVQQIKICNKNKKLNKKQFVQIKDAIENFDFDRLIEIRNENEGKLEEYNPKLYLEQAYISYYLLEYEKAYRYLRICSHLFYRKKQYVWYFITEVNRKNIGKIIQRDLERNYSLFEKEKIENEVRAIDIEKLYDRILQTEIEEKDFLYDIYTFRMYYTIFQDTYLMGKKTEKEAKTNYSFYAGIPQYERLRNRILDCYNYDLNNYIMVDKYQEVIEIYRLFAHTILRSVCSPQLSTEENEETVFNTGNIKVKCLEKFDVYIILRYMTVRDLKDLLQENCSGFIELSVDALEYLKKIFLNISKLKYNKNFYLKKYLILIGYIKLDSDWTAEILLSFSKKFDDYFVREFYSEVMRLVWQADKQNLFVDNRYDEILENGIEKIVANMKKTREWFYYKNILYRYLDIYQKISNPYFSENLLTLIDKENWVTWVDLYSVCAKKIQKRIKKYSQKWKQNSEQIDVYLKLVTAGIIKPDIGEERYILSRVPEIKKKSQGVKPNQYENIINSLANLYLKDKLLERKKFRQIIEDSDKEIYKWLLDLDNYNYEDFNISWLERFSSEGIKIISSNIKAKHKILEKIKESYMEGKISQNVLNIFFEYFL